MIKRWTTTALGLVIALGGAMTFADDDKNVTPPEIQQESQAAQSDDAKPGHKKAADKKKPSASSKAEVTSKKGKTSIAVRSFGKIIQVGPDGKVEVKDFSSDGDDPTMKQLHEKIRRLLNENKANGSDDAADGDKEKRKLRGLPMIGQLLKAGKDGKFEALEGLAELAPMIKGEIIIEGTDGKNRIDIAGDAESISKQLQEALKNSGIEISDVEIDVDVADEINKAIGRLHRNMPGLRGRVQDRIHGSSDAGNKQLDAISEKLDMIIDKIDKLEQDVIKLQKRKKS